MKRTIFFSLLITIFSVSLTGCESLNRTLKEKFVRKKKQETVQVTRAVGEEEGYPNAVSYKMHYVYWDAWMTELVNYLGESKKKDLANCRRAVDNLEKMKEFLKEEKALLLTPHIEELHGIKKDFIGGKITSAVDKKITKRNLNKLWMNVRRDFAPYKLPEDAIKSNIK